MQKKLDSAARVAREEAHVGTRPGAAEHRRPVAGAGACGGGDEGAGAGGDASGHLQDAGSWKHLVGVCDDGGGSPGRG